MSLIRFCLGYRWIQMPTPTRVTITSNMKLTLARQEKPALVSMATIPVRIKINRIPPQTRVVMRTPVSMVIRTNYMKQVNKQLWC